MLLGAYTKEIAAVFLRGRPNWESCPLSGTPHQEE